MIWAKRSRILPRKRRTPEEIIQHLRTVEVEQSKGVSIEEAARKVGVTPPTLARWKAEYGGLRVDQAKRMKDLEQENVRLKKIVADLSILSKVDSSISSTSGLQQF